MAAVGETHRVVSSLNQDQLFCVGVSATILPAPVTGRHQTTGTFSRVTSFGRTHFESSGVLSWARGNARQSHLVIELCLPCQFSSTVVIN